MASSAASNAAATWKSEFITQIERGLPTVAHLPVTSAILRHVADSLKAGDPPWWPPIAKAWRNRVFLHWTQAWGLLLSAVHYEALADAENPLVPYFPSCGGTAEADPVPAFEKFMKDPPATFFEWLARGYRIPYGTFGSQQWLVPAMRFFHMEERFLPYYLVHINAGAGFALIADYLNPHPSFDHNHIAARIGLETYPLDVRDLLHRRWLTASVEPDNVEALASLDKQADKLIGLLEKDPNYVQLVPCGHAVAPDYLAANIPLEEDVGLMLFSVGVTAALPDEMAKAYELRMAQMMAPWKNRALWLDIEPVRGELYSTTFQARLCRVTPGGPAWQLLSTIDPLNSSVRIEPAHVAFLKP